MNQDLHKLLIANSLNKSEIIKKFPDEYQQILNLTPDNIAEKIYWYLHNIKEYPKCICGNNLIFRSRGRGYSQYCCTKCMNSDPKKQEKTKQIILKRYGVEHAMQAQEVKDKYKQTCLDKYGVVSTMQAQEVKDKAHKTYIERYGPGHEEARKKITEKLIKTYTERHGGMGNASPTAFKKQKQTCLERYGNPNYNNNAKSVQTQRERYGGVGNESLILKEKFKKSYREKIIADHDYLIGYTEDGLWICKCPHPECNKCAEKQFITETSIYFDRIRSCSERCTHLLPIQASHSAGTTIELFVQNILDEYSISYETNKAIFDGKHADIWIPELNLAIECNGTFHHSDRVKSQSYHIDKYKCACSKNIKLLTFWSDQIYTKPEIVKSMILNQIYKTPNKIYARQCKIQNVDSKVSSQFLESNHIQGSSPTSIRIGLYYNDELVSLMTFTKQLALQGFKANKNTWVLNRFCNKLYYNVPGAASKLLKYFIKKYQPVQIVSYAACDISTGNLYKRLGFETDGIINSSYWYIKGNKRYHRTQFCKANIVKLGWKEKVDNTWKEHEVMTEHKYLRIFDSGTIKFVLNL